MPSSVLHITNHFNPCTGGIETHVEKLCAELQKLGFHAGVACLNSCSYNAKSLPRYENVKGIEVFRFPYLDLRFYKIAPSVISLFADYDIIHVHGLGFLSDFSSITKPFHKKPLILTTHGGPFHTKSFLPFKTFYFSLQRPLLKGFDRVIAVSRRDQRLFSGVCRPVHISNGIDYAKLSSIKRKPEKGNLLFIGRISSNKRVDNLLRFLKYLGEGHRLIIAGEDWQGLQPSLEALAKNLGIGERAEFLGKVNETEKAELLKKAEFFVSASEYEGFGISALEAMAAGCIPVLSNIEAFRELVNKGSGLLADFSSPEKAAREFRKFKIEQNLIEIEKRCRNFAKAFDWTRIAEKTAHVYEPLF